MKTGKQKHTTISILSLLRGSIMNLNNPTQPTTAKKTVRRTPEDLKREKQHDTPDNKTGPHNGEVRSQRGLK